MAVNKVNFGSETLIDLTEDTVTADKMLQGTTAHSADGEIIKGNIKTQYVSEGVGFVENKTIMPTKVTETNNDEYVIHFWSNRGVYVPGGMNLSGNKLCVTKQLFGLNNFRTGTSEPDNSVGNDGDWYLVTEG